MSAIGSSVCGLDIGSNTFSATELRKTPLGIDVVADASYGVRLSEDLAPGKEIKPQALERGLSALDEISSRFELRKKKTRAVATAVLRIAANPDAFTVPAARILGVPVEIISGDEEAVLTSRGALLHIGGERAAIVVDVGGQSTEVCLRKDSGEIRPVSLPIGVVGLLESFVKNDPPEAGEMQAARDHCRGVIQGGVPAAFSGDVVLVAGTATTLGAIELGLDSFSRKKIHGMTMDADRISFWRSRMLALDSVQRASRYGVGPHRSDVFPLGLLVFEEIVSHFGSRTVTISANGLRTGVALGLLRKEQEHES